MYAALGDAADHIQKLVNSSPESLEAMSQLCERVCTPSLAIEALGFKHHPAYKKLLEETGGSTRKLNRSHWGGIVDIIYHCDAMTLYSCVDKDVVLKFTR